jgi:uncharacterized protein YdhG (YjbR/CyaY superfamily)
MQANKSASVDDYIAAFPEATQILLEEIRSVIRKAAPDAQECISYGMPAFRCNGPLVYFAGYKAHIGFYPTASGIKNFTKEISAYKSSKGAVQFPIDAPLPAKLITQIVMFRVKENKEKASLKAAKRLATKAGG